MTAIYVGIGNIEINPETQEDGTAGKLCKVFTNSMPGYLRVYLQETMATRAGKVRNVWVGPKQIKTEYVELQA